MPEKATDPPQRGFDFLINRPARKVPHAVVATHTQVLQSNIEQARKRTSGQPPHTPPNTIVEHPKQTSQEVGLRQSRDDLLIVLKSEHILETTKERIMDVIREVLDGVQGGGKSLKEGCNLLISKDEVNKYFLENVEDTLRVRNIGDFTVEVRDSQLVISPIFGTSEQREEDFNRAMERRAAERIAREVARRAS